MSYARRQVKRDKNHVAVVSEMRLCGIDVTETWDPLDTLCWHRGFTVWVEIKVDGGSERFTRKQLAFISTTPTAVIIARSGAEAVESIKKRTELTPGAKQRIAGLLIRNSKDLFTPLDVRKAING